jgi:hypothetical protein
VVPAAGGTAREIVGPFPNPPEPFGFYGFLTWAGDVAWHR